jgi:hypothetical protein
MKNILELNWQNSYFDFCFYFHGIHKIQHSKRKILSKNVGNQASDEQEQEREYGG